MSLQLHHDDVVARLQAGAPGYPAAGPDAGRTLAAARKALRRSRSRRAVTGVGAVFAILAGFTALGPIQLPGIGTVAMPFVYDLSQPSLGDPPIYPRERMLSDVARLELELLPVAEELQISGYINDPSFWGSPKCRVLTWSQGAFRDRDPGCVNPDDPELPFDAASEAAFARVTDAIGRSHVDVYRIAKGGWGPGTSFHLSDNSWQWNWYYSYIPGTPTDAPAERRSQTGLGDRREVHVTGNWWFTAEPDD